MLIRIRSVLVLFVAGICLTGGCAESTQQAAIRSAPAPHKQPTLSAQATVQAVVDGLKASKPMAFWDFLDSNQQSDLNQIVRKLAQVVDPEVWQHTTRNVQKLAHVMETKQEYLLESPLWQAAGIKRAEVKSLYGPTAQLLKTIAQIELVDQEKMKQFDGQSFFTGTGTTFFVQAHQLLQGLKDDPLSRLDGLKVKTRTSADGMTTATLEPADPKAKPFEFVLSESEGKWIAPQLSLVIGHLATRAESYHKLFKTYYLADWKDGYIAQMNRLEKALDRLEAAKTGDEFQAVAVRDLLPAILQTVTLARKGLPKYHGIKAMSYNRRETTALVLIKGKHLPDEPSLRALISRLNQIDPRPESVTMPRVVEDSTLVLVDPVVDINTLARSAGDAKVVQADAKRKTLIVELPDSTGDKKTGSSGARTKSASASR